MCDVSKPGFVHPTRAAHYLDPVGLPDRVKAVGRSAGYRFSRVFNSAMAALSLLNWRTA